MKFLLLIGTAVLILGCSSVAKNGEVTENIEVYDDPIYAPVAMPESPALFDLPTTYEPELYEFYEQPFNDLYY